MSFNQYMAHAIREERIKRIVAAKYRAYPTAKMDDHRDRESIEQAAAAERNAKLPRFDYASIKGMRICHPRVS